jgi:hypothetical protein
MHLYFWLWGRLSACGRLLIGLLGVRVKVWLRLRCSVGQAILPAAGFLAGSAVDVQSRPAGWKAGCSQDWLPHPIGTLVP